MPNFWIILFAATVSQGYFLSLALGLKERWKNKAVNLLSLLILAFTLTLSYYLAFWLGYSTQLPRILGLSMRLTLLFGPLLWFYIQTVQKKPINRAWLHLLPFIVSVVVPIPFFRSPYFSTISLSVTRLQIIQLIAYSIMIISLVEEKSLKVLAYTFTGFVACFVSYYLMAWTGVLRLKYDYMVSFGMSVFIYYLGYKGLQASRILPEESTEKYSNSALTNDALNYIINKLDQIMSREKLFLNGDLKLQDLADALNVSVHSLSQAINSGKNQKFNDYLNELRVEEAQRLMASDSHQEMKLIAIALDSGFNNKTSFLNAFKKYTGHSPSEFREKLLAQAS